MGTLPTAHTAPQQMADKLRRTLGQTAVDHDQKRKPRAHTVPAGGDGGVRNPNLPPPSRPHENDLDVTPEHRPGIPYPEWNAWTRVSCRITLPCSSKHHSSRANRPPAASAELQKWFQEHTHRAMKNRLEDGSDLDVEQYVKSLHRPDHRRSDRAADLPRTAAQQSRRHHGPASRRQLIAGRARRQDLQARIGLRRRAVAGDDTCARTSRHLRLHRQHPTPRRGLSASRTSQIGGSSRQAVSAWRRADTPGSVRRCGT